MRLVRRRSAVLRSRAAPWRCSRQPAGIGARRATLDGLRLIVSRQACAGAPPAWCRGPLLRRSRGRRRARLSLSSPSRAARPAAPPFPAIASGCVWRRSIHRPQGRRPSRSGALVDSARGLRLPRGRPRTLTWAASPCVAVVGAERVSQLRRCASRLIVVADFDNQTGEVMFDTSLATPLPWVGTVRSANLLSRARIDDR